MKKSFTVWAAIVLCMMMITSCATTSKIIPTNSVAISAANFHQVRPISRKITGRYLLGFGGSARKAALEKAITDMTKELGPNQALAYINVVESTKVPFLPIIVTQTSSVSAVIIEFDR